MVVHLERDPKDPNLFKWTTTKQPQSEPISSGTLCEGTITLSKQPPIKLVLPFLKSSGDK